MSALSRSVHAPRVTSRSVVARVLLACAFLACGPVSEHDVAHAQDAPTFPPLGPQVVPPSRREVRAAREAADEAERAREAEEARAAHAIVEFVARVGGGYTAVFEQGDVPLPGLGDGTGHLDLGFALSLRSRDGLGATLGYLAALSPSFLGSSSYWLQLLDLRLSERWVVVPGTRAELSLLAELGPTLAVQRAVDGCGLSGSSYGCTPSAPVQGMLGGGVVNVGAAMRMSALTLGLDFEYRLLAGARPASMDTFTVAVRIGFAADVL